MSRLFDHVLVAFDGSETAHDALALALRLLDPAGTLVLACVVEQHGWRPRARERDRACDDAEAMLLDVRSRIPTGVHVRIRAAMASSAARGITELAESEHADLIAVGSAHGAATDGRIGLARTAGRLLQGGPCAVAVAPPGLRESASFRHVGVAIDGSPESAAALAAAYAIARAAGSAMTLYSAIDPLSVSAGDDDAHVRLAVQELLDGAADAAPEGVNPRTELLFGATASKIAGACEGVVDLLVCGSRGYGPVQRAFLGSVSEELIARSRQPVLVVPRPAAVASAAAAA
jgi:nucleotide-binding universal stress UspA family protein